MKLQPYYPSLCRAWNDFVIRSKNATFMLHRNYMEYHSDRFKDCSLLVYDDKDRLIALFPANDEGEVVCSHRGLTYGGLLMDERMTLPLALRVFEALVEELRRHGFRKLIYKTIPTIYHTVPAEEDRYALFRLGAHLYRRDTLTVIDYRHRLKYQERRRRQIKKAMRKGLSVRRSNDLEQFWQILTHNLLARYKVKPVHTIEEIRLLQSRFPDNIQLFASYIGEKMLAGAVAYVSRDVCHIQYNAASEEGKQCGALDIVLDFMIQHFADKVRYFDFGISNEEEGRYLNTGLDEYKEGFGGRTVVHDFYELPL